MPTPKEKKIERALELAAEHLEHGPAVDAYRAGRDGEIPEWLAPFHKEAEMMDDAEYAEFLRLKRKFSAEAAKIFKPNESGC